MDKVVVDRSADESTNESHSNKFFSCGYIARGEIIVKKPKASKAIWSFLNSGTIFLMIDQTFIHLWITSQKGF